MFCLSFCHAVAVLFISSSQHCGWGTSPGSAKVSACLVWQWITEVCMNFKTKLVVVVGACWQRVDLHEDSQLRQRKNGRCERLWRQWCHLTIMQGHASRLWPADRICSQKQSFVGMSRILSNEQRIGQTLREKSENVRAMRQRKGADLRGEGFSLLKAAFMTSKIKLVCCVLL